MSINDIFSFNQVNLDSLTETYNLLWYFEYFSKWPEHQNVVLNPENQVMAYIIGKSEGAGETWHGHVSAVTVGPAYRRIGLASKLMRVLEEASTQSDCYFVDLFVRVSNVVAIEMYRRFGYVVYRTILKYYSGEENAYDMRKALPRDVQKKSMVPLKNPVNPWEIELTM